MSIYEEAWNKLTKELEDCRILLPSGWELNPQIMLDECLAKARQRAEQTQAELRKALQETNKVMARKYEGEGDKAIISAIERKDEYYLKKAGRLAKEALKEKKKDIVEDGFGSSASAVCPICGCRAVYVCRPGDIRCGVCYDNNPKEWYTGSECPECGMSAVHNGVCFACDTFKE